jgi:uncharacterized protein
MLRFLIVTLIVLALLKLAVMRLEPAMVFFPYRGEDETPARVGLRYQAIRLRASDGVEIAAWQIEHEQAKADIVYFHGNGGNLSMWLPAFEALHANGYRVLAIDYRGYGTSDGAPSERGLALDAEAAARHAHASRTPGRPLVFWGRSLGAAVAAVAARVVAPDALVLENTFPDKASVIRGNPVLQLLNLFSSYRFDTATTLRGFERPVLVLHGDADTIVPYALGQELFDRLDGPKRFVTVRGADHNDLFDARQTAYWTPIRAFLDAL